MKKILIINAFLISSVPISGMEALQLLKVLPSANNFLFFKVSQKS